MNILLLTHGVPYPPDTGPRAKTYRLIRHLAERHRLTLVCLGQDDTGPIRAAALRPLCADVHLVPSPESRWTDLGALLGSLLGSRPYTLARLESQELRALLPRLLDEAAAHGNPFDLAHVDQIVMAPYAEALPLPRLLDAHNAVWQIFAELARQRGPLGSWLATHEAALLRAYEGQICASFEAVMAVSEEDRQALLAAAGQECPITVVPIGVDGSALKPVQRISAPRSVLSLATPGWPPNAEGIAWFAREVFPLVRRAVPESTLFICGANPTAELRSLAERQPAIEVTGFVDPQPYLEQAGVLIAPLRSRGGMRVMLLEALAREIPVVATGLACADLDLTPGEHLLVADTPSEFADAVALLLRDQELGARLAAAGRRRVLERYDWRAVYSAVDRIYAHLTTRSAPIGNEAPIGEPVVNP